MQLAMLNEADSRRDLLRRLVGKGGSKPRGTEPQQTSPPTTQQPEAAPEPSVGSSDRRGFMKTVGSVAASATGQGPLMSIAKASMGGDYAPTKYDAMSDEKLMNTPEQLWIPNVEPGRAANIAKKYPDHGRQEAVAKVVKLVTYGFLKAKGIDPNKAHGISKGCEKIVNNANDALKAIGSQWQLNGTDLIKSASQQLVYCEPGEAIKFAEFLEQHGKDYNIAVDKDIRKVAQEVDQQVRGIQSNHDHTVMKRTENRRARNSEDEMGRWADDGGLTYESRLARVFKLR